MSDYEKLFRQMSYEQLIEMNKLTVRLANEKRSKILSKVASSLVVGSQVYFNHSKDGRKIEGTLIKINRKTAKIRTSAGVQWNVTISLIKNVSENRSAA